MIHKIGLLSAIVVGIVSVQASATTFTRTSPTSEGLVPAGVTEVGGLVTDIVGLNGARVVAQIAASSLFQGQPGTTPITIGTQTGFDSSVTGALGGGIAEMAIRITLFDGDTGPGDFDDNLNTLEVNGFTFDNFSDVVTRRTNSTGTSEFSTNASGGFRNGILDTGWFFSTDATLLTNIFNSIVSNETIEYELRDVDPGDNFFDFTQGVDGSLIDVGSGPQVTPAVPSPSAVLAGVALFGGMILRRRTRKA